MPAYPGHWPTSCSRITTRRRLISTRPRGTARTFDEYCKRRPQDPVGFVGRGVALEAHTKFEKAVLSYETAIILGSTDTLATEGRERARRRQTCDKGACLNLMKMPGWWDTVGRH